MGYKIIILFILMIWVFAMAAGLLLALNPSDFNIQVDNWLNLRNPVDKFCQIDYDCDLKITNCDTCDCKSLDAVSRSWKPFCPFPGEKRCEACKTRHLKAKCIKDVCTMQEK